MKFIKKDFSFFLGGELVEAKTICERFVLVSGWRLVAKFTSMPLTHTAPLLILQLFLDFFGSLSLMWCMFENIHYIMYVSKVHCGSAFGPGASSLPSYCAPLVCVLNGLGGLAVWRLTHKQINGMISSVAAIQPPSNHLLLSGPLILLSLLLRKPRNLWVSCSHRTCLATRIFSVIPSIMSQTSRSL